MAATVLSSQLQIGERNETLVLENGSAARANQALFDQAVDQNAYPRCKRGANPYIGTSASADRAARRLPLEDVGRHPWSPNCNDGLGGCS
jgi:hypothetical protein